MNFHIYSSLVRCAIVKRNSNLIQYFVLVVRPKAFALLNYVNIIRQYMCNNVHFVQSKYNGTIKITIEILLKLQ